MEFELVEVEREVLEDVRFLGVIAVAENGPPLEMRAVMPQLVLDIRELGVELIFLGVARVFKRRVFAMGTPQRTRTANISILSQQSVFNPSHSLRALHRSPPAMESVENPLRCKGEILRLSSP